MIALPPWLQRLRATTAPASTWLIRLAVGCVFLSEGIQKYLYPDALGAGRFARIGLPWPGFLGPFVGAFEVVCGALMLLGLFTRLAALPLIAIMLVALGSTKVPILLDKGLWAAAHEARTDVAMLCGALFLFAAGPGPWSLDGRAARRARAGD